MFGAGQARRLGGEFFLLRRGREVVVGLGVKDDVSEQFLAEPYVGALSVAAEEGRARREWRQPENIATPESEAAERERSGN